MAIASLRGFALRSIGIDWEEIFPPISNYFGHITRNYELSVSRLHRRAASLAYC